MVNKYLGAVAFSNITGLKFGKRFLNPEGVLDEQGGIQQHTSLGYTVCSL